MKGNRVCADFDLDSPFEDQVFALRRRLANFAVGV
jgi:hypothetical protein